MRALVSGRVKLILRDRGRKGEECKDEMERHPLVSMERPKKKPSSSLYWISVATVGATALRTHWRWRTREVVVKAPHPPGSGPGFAC